MHKRNVFLLFVIVISVCTFMIWKRYDPLMPYLTVTLQKPNEWGIGILTGCDPFNLAEPDCIENPVLRANDVTDTKARFVADPFMISKDGIWYMFFEILNHHSGHGDIGLATSKDGYNWKYEKIVLNEPFHLSYPCVFEYNGEFYMVPETINAHAVRLYKAVEFPTKWLFVKDLLQGVSFADPTIFHYQNKWWLFVFSHPDILRLYFSDSPLGGWQEHPKSPINNNPNSARPGGNIIVCSDRIIRFAQDIYPTYGNKVRAMAIDVLTINDYSEHEIPESPILEASGKGWNADGMHQMDLHMKNDRKWIACVDGIKWGWKFSKSINYPRTRKTKPTSRQ